MSVIDASQKVEKRTTEACASAGCVRSEHRVCLWLLLLLLLLLLWLSERASGGAERWEITRVSKLKGRAK